MATHFSILAWKIPWAEDPGGLSESERVRHDLGTKHTNVKLFPLKIYHAK